MKRFLILTALLCGLLSAASGQELGKWQAYLSYYIATRNVAVGNTIYSLMNGNLLSYDTEDGEVRTYDHLGVLNDVGIAHIAYSKEAGRLIIVYQDSNIDLLDADDNVINLPALKEKSIANKEVSYVNICGTMAYLATGFGFVEVDMKEGVFRNTYRLGFDIRSIAATDQAVFIGCADGIRRCARTDNMHLDESWTLHFASINWSQMQVFQDRLMAVNPSGLYIFYLDRGGIIEYNKESGITYLNVCGDQLIWGSASQVAYTTDITAPPTVIRVDNKWTDVTYGKGTYWMSEQENGLKSYKTDGTAFEPTGVVIQPSSPIRDLGYNLKWEGDRLLVAGGINTVGSFHNPATSMYYEDGKWTNFTEMEIPADMSRMNLYNTTNLVQDPLDPTHHFASPFRSGLFEYRNGKFVKWYNRDNSPLRPMIPSQRWFNYQSCSALSYDAKGNLWMANSQVDTMFHVLKPDGKWYSLFYEEQKASSLVDQILHHSSGLVFVSSRRLEQRGIFVINTKGTERYTDDQRILHQNIVNQDGTPYTPDQFFCVCEDQDGLVWVGTSSGLFVMDDLDHVFSQNYQFTQIKINRNDGSGLADYLLNDVSIACITTDAANRKWIGTQSNGAYLISADGQEMIHHFTTADSPLLSNNVQSIAVNGNTGEVVFGTDKGLCSFMGDATEPEEKLEKGNVVVYPNPVTPDYTGPIAIRGLVRDSEVKIISTGGQLVWNGVSNGGTCIWNGCANDGGRVASGIYHVVANNAEGGSAVVTRIVIVR